MSFPFNQIFLDNHLTPCMNQFPDELGLNEEVNENSSTNYEAVLCKISASKCGLLPDKFIAEFVNHPHHHGHPKRHTKPPIINRGTFLRTVSIDSITREFIKTNIELGNAYQIISLGGGFDTRLFRFMDEFNKNIGNLKYFELDFSQIIEEKLRIIENSITLKDLSDPLILISCNLNEKFDSSILGSEFDPEAPTLIIAECCLMYLTAESGDDLISWAGNNLKSVIFCSFDPILSEDLNSDRFAKIMLENFEKRGLDTKSLLEYPSKQSTLNRFSKHFPSVEGFTMLQLERDASTEFLVSKQQRREIIIKTALDEYEEWNLLADHYLLLIAKK